MKTLLHDLEPEELRRILPKLPQEIRVIEKGETQPAPCMGCFGCWTRTPGHCVIRDGYGDLSPLLGHCSDYIILSRVVYGDFSPFIKTVLDRNIGYLLPYFTVRNKEMHHVSRYPDRLRFTVVGYGNGLTGEEQETFRGIAAANGINLETSETRVFLLREPDELAELKEVLG